MGKKNDSVSKNVTDKKVKKGKNIDKALNKKLCGIGKDSQDQVQSDESHRKKIKKESKSRSKNSSSKNRKKDKINTDADDHEQQTSKITNEILDINTLRGICQNCCCSQEFQILKKNKKSK